MMYLSNFCCICLNKCKNLEKFNDCNESKSYYDKILICIPQMDFDEISRTGLICKECTKRIDQTYNFREECLRNNEKLKEILKSEENDEEEIIELGNGIILQRKNVEKNTEKSDSSILKRLKVDLKSSNRELKNNEKNKKFEFENGLTITNENVPVILKNELASKNNENVPVIFKKLNIGLKSVRDEIEIIEESRNEINIIEDITKNNPNISITKNKKNDSRDNEIDFEFVDYETNRNEKKDIKIEQVDTEDYFDSMDYSDSDDHKDVEDDYSDTKELLSECKNVESFLCKICDKNFTNLEEFQSHSIEHVNINFDQRKCFDAIIDSVLTCKICFVTFPDTDSLKYHLPIHKNNRVYKCNICDEVFGKLRLLKLHKSTHSNKTYTCDICNKLFLRLDQFEEHKMKHISEGPYKCEFCTKTYIKLQDLKAHESTHTNERYTCDICNRCFYKLQQLEDHKIIHTSIRPYSCDVCNKSFYQISNLKIHKLIHTGERPHVCDVCNKAFVQISHLKSHKLVHTNERPYVCDICHKSYQQSCYLKVHKLAHTGEKPHTCKGCGRAYTRASYVRKHQKKTNCLLKLKGKKNEDPLYIP